MFLLHLIENTVFICICQFNKPKDILFKIYTLIRLIMPVLIYSQWKKRLFILIVLFFVIYDTTFRIHLSVILLSFVLFVVE